MINKINKLKIYYKECNKYRAKINLVCNAVSELENRNAGDSEEEQHIRYNMKNEYQELRFDRGPSDKHVNNSHQKRHELHIHADVDDVYVAP